MGASKFLLKRAIGADLMKMTKSRQTNYDSPQGSDSSEEDIDDCSPSRKKS